MNVAPRGRERRSVMTKSSRSAITGQYVKPSYAKQHPKTTVTENSGKKK
jgi:hypothetical protein